jgi:hypothetical protein
MRRAESVSKTRVSDKTQGLKRFDVTPPWDEVAMVQKFINAVKIWRKPEREGDATPLKLIFLPLTREVAPREPWAEG